MGSVAFDTLKAAKQLGEAGFEPEQAEALVTTFAQGLNDNLVTKEDLEKVEERLNTKIERAKYDLTWRLLGGIALINGLMFALLRYMPTVG